MFKRIASTALIVLLVGSMSSCIFDPEPKPPDEKKADPWPELTTKEAVLTTLSRAYNERNISRYASIFDQDNFVFHFAPGDVGGDVPEQWGYTEEYNSANNMFSGAGGTKDNPVLSIELTLSGITGATWTGVEDSRFPGETLKQATINYTYYIDTEADIQFITSGAPKAQFILREVDGKWQLVTWFDVEGT